MEISDHKLLHKRKKPLRNKLTLPGDLLSIYGLSMRILIRVILLEP